MSLELAHGYNAKPQDLKKVWKFRAVLLSLILFIVVIIYSPLFRIRNVIITQSDSRIINSKIDQLVKSYIAKPKFFIIPQNNLLLFSPGACSDYLKEQVYLSDLDFSRQWPSVLRLSIKQNPVVAIWQSGPDLYLVDKRGVVVQKIDTQYDEPNLFMVKNNLSPIKLGDTVMTEGVTKFVSEFIEVWKNKDLPVAIDYFSLIEGDLPTLYVITKEGWQVKVSSINSAEEQVLSVLQILQQKFKDTRSQLDYLDVRYGSRVFIQIL